jgi:hypothetical protein
MKKLSVVVALVLLASCGHSPKDPSLDRTPSNTTEVMSCGLISSTETSRNAVDVNWADKVDDRHYSMQIDCNKDQLVDLSSEKLVVGIPMSQVKPGQRGWITRWRKLAVKVQQNQSAKPYVCMTYQAAYDPCTANRNAYAMSPKFSGKINFGKKVK